MALLSGILISGCHYAWTPYQVRIPTEATSVPLELRAGIPIVEVYLNGEGPYRFLLDTGTAVVAVDKKLATELNLSYRRGKQRISDPLGQKEKVQVCRVGSFLLGESRFEEFDAIVADLEGLQFTPIDGILGTGLFDQCRLTIDYVNRLVRVEESGKPPEIADRPNVLPLRHDRFGLSIPVRYKTMEMWCLIDSGAYYDLYFERRGIPSLVTLDSEPVLLPSPHESLLGLSTAYAARARDSFFLGQVEIQRPIVTSTTVNRPNISEKQLRTYLPRLGGRVLNNFAVTIDQKAHVAIFSRNGQAPIVPPSPSIRYGGLYVEREANGIRLVDGDNPQPFPKTCGLQVGDLIVAIDGRSTTELSDAEFERLLEENDTMKLTIHRAGKRIDLECSLIVIK